MFSKMLSWLNDIKPRQLLILAGSVMLAMFIFAFTFLSWWTQKEVKEVVEEQAPPVVNMRTVVTAKIDIPAMTPIKTEMLEAKEVPEELVPADAVTEISRMKDTLSKTPIFAGDVITERKLSADIKDAGFVGTIPPDCRAVSISVNSLTGVDGFAKPGDKVDLLLVESKEYSATTNIILQDVLLLSINQNYNDNSIDANGNSTAIQNPSIATLALMPNDILRLVSASKLGEIYMILRPKNPTQKYWDDVAYTVKSANAPKPVVTPPPAPVTQPKPEKPEEYKMTIIRGTEVKKPENEKKSGEPVNETDS